jgi:hypothetical protein
MQCLTWVIAEMSELQKEVIRTWEGAVSTEATRVKPVRAVAATTQEAT